MRSEWKNTLHLEHRVYGGKPWFEQNSSSNMIWTEAEFEDG